MQVHHQHYQYWFNLTTYCQVLSFIAKSIVDIKDGNYHILIIHYFVIYMTNVKFYFLTKHTTRIKMRRSSFINGYINWLARNGLQLQQNIFVVLGTYVPVYGDCFEITVQLDLLHRHNFHLLGVTIHKLLLPLPNDSCTTETT